MCEEDAGSGPPIHNNKRRLCASNGLEVTSDPNEFGQSEVPLTAVAHLGPTSANTDENAHPLLLPKSASTKPVTVAEGSSATVMNQSSQEPPPQPVSGQPASGQPASGQQAPHNLCLVEEVKWGTPTVIQYPHDLPTATDDSRMAKYTTGGGGIYNDRTPIREYEKCHNRLYQALDGYYTTAEELDQTLCQFVDLMLHCPQLPIAELKQCFGIFEIQMPMALRERFVLGIERLEAALQETFSLARVDPSAYGAVSAGTAASNCLFAPLPPSAVHDTKSKLHVIRERCGSPTEGDHDCKDPYRDFNELLKDTIQDLHFTLSRECNDEIVSYEDLSVFQVRAELKAQLAPVETLLVRYFQGYVAACVVEIRALFLAYLEVEDIFHDSDIDVPGLVIHSKRPEYDPEQLLLFARSHQALKMKNRLMIGLLELIKTSPELMDHTDQFDSCLRRLASLSKIDYSTLSHEARQLLLTRREKVSFSQRTHDLIETLWEILESYHVPPALSGPTSPVTFGGRLWNAYWLSPTPGSANFVGQSVGSHTGHAGGTTTSIAQTFPGGTYVSSTYIGLCALDLCKFPTDSLIAILGHHSPKLKKLAIHILVMRIFGIRPGKIHDFRVKAQGESWDTPNLESNLMASSTTVNGSSLGALVPGTEKTPMAWTGLNSVTLVPVEGGVGMPYGSTSLESGVGGTSAAPGVGRMTTRGSGNSGGIGLQKCATLTAPRSGANKGPKSPDGGAGTAVPGSNQAGLVLPTVGDRTSERPGSASSDQRGSQDGDGCAGLQEVNALIAVWTHDAVISYDWLICNCDPLRGGKGGPRDMNGLLAGGNGPLNQNSAAAMAAASAHEGSITSRLDPTGTKSGSTLASKYVAAGSRLHHMLNAFAGPSETDSQGMGGRSQQTTAFLIENSADFEASFKAGIEEIELLQPCLPPSPPAVDGRILLCVVLDLNLQNSGWVSSRSEKQFGGGYGGAVHDEPNHASFRDVINQNEESLRNLNINLIWVAYLGGKQSDEDSLSAETSVAEAISRRLLQKPKLHKHKSRSLNFLPLESPGLKCFYYRNVTSLPISMGQPGWALIENVDMAMDLWKPDKFESTINAGPTTEYTTTGQLARPQGPGASTAGSAGTDFSALAPSSAAQPFVEETLLRHCEIPFFQYLELKRLRNFHVAKHPTCAPNVHLFEAVPKYTQNSEKAPPRFFVRIVANVNAPLTSEVGLFEQERAFVNGLNALELCLRDAGTSSTSALRPVGNHHILMAVVYIPHMSLKKWYSSMATERFAGAGSHGAGGSQVRASPTASASGYHAAMSGAPASETSQRDLESMKLTPSAAEQIARDLWERYSKRIQKLGASVIEIRFKTRGWQSLGHLQGSPSLTEGVYPYRIVLDNPTGQTLRSRRFVEIQNPSTGERVFAALDSGDSLSTLILKSHSSAHDDTESRQALGGAAAAADSPSLFNTFAGGKDSRETNDYEGKPVDTVHPWAGRLESKRVQAAALQTLYIYDFIELLEVAVKTMWRKCPKYLFGPGEENLGGAGPAREGSSAECIPRTRTRTSGGDDDVLPPLLPTATTLVPDRVVEAIELALNKNGDLVELARAPGQNECGMVAWRVLLRTPEFPQGRRIVLIGNDVTYFNGTFGVQEDLLFQRASELARLQGIPRIYIAVNSGARMGLATEVQNAFKVEWIDAENPTKGFKYLYVTDDDYRKLQLTESIIAETISHTTEGKVWKILDIIGANIGLGVENLCGSGAIAGETARAYKNSMTITYVTGRTVGIGAYLARLGQRVIQKNTGAPILLTGFQALNRLIGRQVYTSNDEIGGVDVMHCNGVSHIVVRSDLEGCEAILEWLSFVPEHREGPLPVMIDPGDPIARRIEYRPSSSTDDPRLMLTGCVDQNGSWLGGILDRGSFKEVMTGWAKSVIVGRGRLGGIPVGVISVETRVTETLIPADPAMPLTSEVKLTRAGQVWFPDSAYKTVQGISDFNKEEIPLLIFANWRGFSGGQRDMFFEILKFGSMIVDALVDFKQPCFVYVPPKAELRGGAWVVVDPRINSDFIEMFADPDSRGGVLEPSGTVEIKFRDKALRQAAARSDPELRRLTQEDQQLADEGVPIDDIRRQILKERKDSRVNDLMPVFKQVAVHFADLHDTPVRMHKKRAIVDIVSWEKSRQFFYWRLRRQLILFNLRNEAVKQNPKLTLNQAQKIIYHWASESGHSVENSQQFVHWACHSIQQLSRRLHGLRSQYLKETVADFCKESLNAVAEGLKMLDQQSYERLLSLLATDREKRPSTNAPGNSLNRDSKVVSDRQQAALERITM